MFVQGINTNTRKHSTNNAYSTLSRLNYFLKIFGLFCVSSDGNKLKYSWPIWKITIFCILFFAYNSISIYVKLNTKMYQSKSRIQDYYPIIYLLGYIQYIVDLTLVYKFGRQRCLDYYNVYDIVDKVIGMPYYNEIKRSMNKICTFFVIVGSFYLVSDYSAVVVVYGWSLSTIYGIDYIYTVIKLLTALDAISHCNQMKYRLKRMKHILQDYYSNVETLPGVTVDVVGKKDWTKIAYKNRVDLFRTIGYYQPNVVLNLSKCYLLLLEQCDYLNGLFGLRALLGSLVYLFEMVILINYFIRLIIGTMSSDYNSTCLPFIATSAKIVTYCLMLMCGIYCCEQNYKYIDRIVRCIDHLLANKKIPTEEHEALKELRELIMTRPICYSAVNFYSLNYPAMLSMASAVVTYTIILLQNMQ